MIKNPHLTFPIIKEVDLGWAAGFYEGEGSCSHNKDKETCHVSITQKDPEPLVRIQKLFGGIIATYNGYNYWRAYGDEAKIFFCLIFEHLSDRRKAQIIRFEEYLTSPDSCPNGHKYEEGSYRITVDKGRSRSYRTCLACSKEKKLRCDEPMNQAAIALARVLGISKEEAIAQYLNKNQVSKEIM